MKNTKLGKFNLIILAIFVVSTIGLKLWQYHWPTAVLMLKDEPLLVQVAKTPHHQEKGLSERESMGKYDGMLFIFNMPFRVGIVMRDMQFPIDIVWLDGSVVADIAPNVLPEDVSEERLRVYYPRKNVNLVLELPAGWAKDHDLKIGDELSVVSE